MTNEKMLNKLNALASKDSSEWLKKAKWREENRDWLDKSAKIAVRILREIRAQKETKGMSQKTLAEMLNVSPQYNNKIVKGQENLSLETINKIEKALGIILLDITSINQHPPETQSNMIVSEESNLILPSITLELPVNMLNEIIVSKDFILIAKENLKSSETANMYQEYGSSYYMPFPEFEIDKMQLAA